MLPQLKLQKKRLQHKTSFAQADKNRLKAETPIRIKEKSTSNAEDKSKARTRRDSPVSHNKGGSQIYSPVELSFDSSALFKVFIQALKKRCKSPRWKIFYRPPSKSALDVVSKEKDITSKKDCLHRLYFQGKFQKFEFLSYWGLSLKHLLWDRC